MSATSRGALADLSVLLFGFRAELSHVAEHGDPAPARRISLSRPSADSIEGALAL